MRGAVQKVPSRRRQRWSNERGGGATEQAGHPNERPPGPVVEREVALPAGIATKELVGSLANLHDDGAILPRQLGYEVNRYAHRIREWLILVVHHLREEI